MSMHMDIGPPIWTCIWILGPHMDMHIEMDVRTDLIKTCI